MYGNKDNKNMMEGNMAKKKRNAKDDALVVNEFACNPLIKKTTTSKRGTPSKPGKTIRFDQSNVLLTMLI